MTEASLAGLPIRAGDACSDPNACANAGVCLFECKKGHWFAPGEAGEASADTGNETILAGAEAAITYPELAHKTGVVLLLAETIA